MKLYFNPQSRATITRWMLDELGVDYELVHIDFETRQHKSPEYLAINPAGKVPALVDGDTTLFENGAICLYLADKYPEAKLAPAIDAPERGRFLSLMFFGSGQLEPSMGDHLRKVEHHRSNGWNPWETTLDVMEKEIGEGPYLFGEWFTAADVILGSTLAWQQMFNGPMGRPIIDNYVARLLAREHGMMKGAQG